MFLAYNKRRSIVFVTTGLRDTRLGIYFDNIFK